MVIVSTFAEKVPTFIAGDPRVSRLAVAGEAEDTVVTGASVAAGVRVTLVLICNEPLKLIWSS